MSGGSAAAAIGAAVVTGAAASIPGAAEGTGSGANSGRAWAAGAVPNEFSATMEITADGGYE